MTAHPVPAAPVEVPNPTNRKVFEGSHKLSAAQEGLGDANNWLRVTRGRDTSSKNVVLDGVLVDPTVNEAAEHQ